MTIKFIKSNKVEDQLLIGCDQQVEVIKRTLKKIIETKTHKYILCFGMPGCGKSVLADKVAFLVNSEWNLDCSVLHLYCNETVLMPDVKSIEHDLYKVTVHIEQQGPMILSLDELDYIAPHRVRDSQDARYLHLSSKLMGLLSSKFNGKADLCGGLLVLFITNTPLQLECAVLDRVSGGTVYFPLPNHDTSIEILKHFNIKEPGLVYDRLFELLAGTHYSGRGLVTACEQVVQNLDPSILDDVQKTAFNIFRYLPPLCIDQEYVDAYTDEHQHLIQQSDAFLELS